MTIGCSGNVPHFLDHLCSLPHHTRTLLLPLLFHLLDLLKMYQNGHLQQNQTRVRDVCVGVFRGKFNPLSYKIDTLSLNRGCRLTFLSFYYLVKIFQVGKPFLLKICFILGKRIVWLNLLGYNP